MTTVKMIKLCSTGWQLYDRYTSMTNPEIDAPAEADEAYQDYIDHCENCPVCTVNPK